MRILVTGGAGFIGSHYVRSLLAGAYPGFEGARVTVVDSLTYAGNPANLPLDDPRLELVKGDICDQPLLEEVFPGHDAVLHFAAESHVDRSLDGPAGFVRTNVAGTQCVLDAALRCGVPRVVHVSTDEVYGSITEGAWTEESPLLPNSPYSASKAGSDLIARAYWRTHGLDVSITRCSNNYGPHQHVEKLIPRFVTNLLDGQPVPLYGDGGNVREWLHVDDHCRALHLVLTKAARGRSTTSAAATTPPTARSPSSCSNCAAPTGTWSGRSPTARATTCGTRSTTARSASSSATRRGWPSSGVWPTWSPGTGRTAAGGSR